MSKPINPTGHDELLPQTRNCEVRGADNPLDTTESILALHKHNELRRAITRKWEMKTGGFDALLILSARWRINGKASSVSSLAKANRVTVTTTQITVKTLLSKGLIEAVGFGRLGCRVYAPTQIALYTLSRFQVDISATLQ